MLALASAIAIAIAASTAGATALAFRLDTVAPVTGELVIRGALETALDGSTFDATTQRGGSPGETETQPRLGGLFDLHGGGLRVAAQDPAAHLYRLVATGHAGPACAEAGVASPCLVPRLRALAHERLVTADQLAASLSGSLAIEALPPPLVSTAGAVTMAGGATLLAGLAAWGLGRAIRQRRLSTGMGQVHAGAQEARRATRGDPTLAPLRARIDALVRRAQELEAARLACARRLVKIDRAALEQRRATWASRASDPDSAQAVIMLAAETAEADQLEADLSSSLAGLERIASSLRALALRTRFHRGTRARAAQNDPVDALLGELDLREQALVDADRVLIPR